jgi:type III secretion protein J
MAAVRQPSATRLLWPVALFFMVCGCNAEIQHGLKEQEANRIVTTLRKSGIPAEKEAEDGRNPRFTVLVPQDDAAKAFEVLSARNLPRKAPKGVYELFGKTSLVPTSTEEHMKRVYAMGSELAKTLTRMEGVLDARVHLVLPQKGLLDTTPEKRAKPRAAVFLKVEPGKTPVSVPQIQSLIAGAVEALQPESVAVLIQPGTKITLAKIKASASPPMWLKVLALSASGGVLVLAILLVVLALRLRNARLQLEEYGAGPAADENDAQTGSRALYRP